MSSFLQDVTSYVPAWLCVHWIWGSIALSKSQGSRYQCSNLWGFALTSILLTVLAGNVIHLSVGFVIKKTKPSEERRKKYKVIQSVSLSPSIVVTLVWGLIMYFSITDECSTLYQTQFPKLWLWFQAAVWSSVGLTGLVLACEVKSWCYQPVVPLPPQEKV